MGFVQLNQEPPVRVQALLLSVLAWLPGFFLIYVTVHARPWEALIIASWTAVIAVVYYPWVHRSAAVLRLYESSAAESTHDEPSRVQRRIWGRKGIGWTIVGVTPLMLLFTLLLPALLFDMAWMMHENAVFARASAQEDIAGRSDLVENGIDPSTLEVYDDGIAQYRAEARGWDAVTAYYLLLAIGHSIAWVAFTVPTARKLREAMLLWRAARAEPAPQQELIAQAVRLAIDRGRLPAVA